MTKRITTIFLTVLLLIGLTPCALAETSFAGKVIPEDTVAVVAPFGGSVEHMFVREGDVVRKGDKVATLSTTPVYATIEGTVSGVFALPGDSAESVGTRYGAVMYIEPTNRYTLAATTEKAYNKSENKYVHLGETVYLSCTSDGTHRGTGLVSALTDTGYNVEVTGGDFYMGETVGIYRESSYAAESRIGRGTVGRTAPVAVKGTGSILKMHVENGDFVERGELLFETVDGVLDGLYAPDCVIASPLSGVVASVDVSAGAAVSKGDSVVKIYPSDSMQIEISVPEEDLTELKEGQAVDIEFYWDIDETKTYTGTITSISHLSEKAAEGERSDKTYYKAYVTFTPDENVRLGMSVIVYPAGDAIPADDAAAAAPDVASPTPAPQQ